VTKRIRSTESLIAQNRRAKIRKIFIQQRPDYSVTDAVRVLGMKRADILEAIADGYVETKTTVIHRLPWAAVADLALRKWSHEAIYDALGDQAAEFLPPLLMVETVTVRLPAFLVRMLEHFARRERCTVGEALTKELFDVAEATNMANPEGMERLIPGFYAALCFPEE
jgi:hypothetical protein